MGLGRIFQFNVLALVYFLIYSFRAIHSSAQVPHLVLCLGATLLGIVFPLALLLCSENCLFVCLMSTSDFDIYGYDISYQITRFSVY